MNFKDPNEGSFEDRVVKTDDAIMAVTSAMLTTKASLLKKHGISFQQYIILKTLHFARGKPASIKSLTEKMFDKMSNTSRLVAKLEKKGYVDRKINSLDRRQVEIIISKTGERIFKKAAKELNQRILNTYQVLSKTELTVLLETLLKFKAINQE